MISLTRPENQWPAKEFIDSILWAVEQEMSLLSQSKRTAEIERQLTIEAMNSVFEYAGPAGNC